MKHSAFNKFHCLFLFIALLAGNCIKAQDSSKIAIPLYYRFTLGGGLGRGYPLQADDFGVGGLLEFALQKKTNIYSLGIRGLGELELFEQSNVNNSVSSAEIAYGKVFETRSFFATISAGVGYITVLQKGELLSREGGWFSSVNSYQKIVHHTIGLPVAAKIIWVPSRVYGIGTELYVNINSRNTFYGINFCQQLGKLKAKKVRSVK
ncbi:MAG TPA: hypothetical protein VLR49_14535 [Ferruginibacter sp.]|nr:hypothetical protein [Ferruginibacter sp.]